MKRKGLIIFLLLFTLGSALYLYVDKIFLPIQLKEIARHKMEKFLEREVTVSEINYNPLKGVIVKDLTIYQKTVRLQPFISIDEMHLSIPLLNIIKNRKIIIPSITVFNPTVSLIRTGPEEWNFTDILARQKAGASPSAPQLYFGNLTIKQGRVSLTDQTTAPAEREIFEAINIRVALSLKKGVLFELETQVASQSSSFKTEGNYSPLSKELTCQISARKFNFAKFLPLFYKNSDFIVHEGLVEYAEADLTIKKDQLNIQADLAMQARMHIHPDTTMAGHITAKELTAMKQKNHIQITGNLSAKEAAVAIGQDKTMRGDFQAQDFKLSLNGKKIDGIGNLKLLKADLRMGAGKGIRGDLSADGFSFNLQDNEIAVRGNLMAQEAAITLGGDNTLFATIAAPNTFFYKNTDGMRVASQPDIQNTDLKISDQFSFKGKWQADPFDVSWKDQEINLSTSFQTMGSDMRIGKDKHFTGDLSGENTVFSMINKKLTIKSDLQARQAALRLQDGIELNGNPDIVLDLSFDPDAEQKLQYTSSLTFSSAALKGIPLVNEVMNIRGNLLLKPDRLTTESLDLKTLNTSIHLAGALREFSHPVIEVSASSEDVDLAQWRGLFSEQLDKIQLMPEGKAALKLDYTGPLASAKEADIRLTAQLHDAALEDIKDPVRLPGGITRISGRINYDEDSLTWNDLRGTYKETDYTFNGKLSNFSRPVIETQMVSEGLQLSTQVKILRKAFSVSLLKGEYYDTPFNLRGDVHFRENGVVDLECRGQMDLNLSDLTRLPAPSAVVKRIILFKPAGVLSTNLFFKGDIKKWQEGAIIVSAESTELSLSNYKFDTVSIKMDQGDREFSDIKMNASVYDGKFTLTSRADFKKKEMPFSLSAQLNSLNLARLKNASPWRKQDISGKFSMDMDLNGSLKDMDQSQGKSTVQIIDGHLGQIKLLKGLWGLLLIPEFETIVFTEGRANFLIQDKRAQTHDLILTSAPLDLFGKGWIDFDNNISFEIRPKVKESSIIRSESSIKKGPTAIMAQIADNTIVKISGTLKKPQFKKVLLPSKVIKNATGTLLEGVQGILEDIFN